MPSTVAEPDGIHVAVGVIRDEGNKILIAKRPQHLHAGGLWEFPGGKVEKGETVLQALHRELHEELGIAIAGEQPLITIHHKYPEKTVLLDVWQVSLLEGNPAGLQGQELKWVHACELPGFEFPEANHRIVNLLQLSRSMVITGEFSQETDFLQKLRSALSNGNRCIQLRAHDCDTEQYSRLYSRALECCDLYQAILITNTTVELHKQLGARGLHLTSARLMECKARPVSKQIILGASCHSLDEIEHANRIGVDYVTLGPVFPTPSHSQQEGMGWEQFSELVQSSDAPVFALGGIKERMLGTVIKAGGFGVAGISEFWRSCH